jgi:hypothetical protein
MHPRRLTIALAPLWVLAALTGCHTGPYVNAHIETLNAEYRQLEDYVYCLEDDNARLQSELDALQAGGRTPSGQPRTPRTSPLRRPESSGAESSSDLSPPQIDPGMPSETPPRRLNRPEIDAPPEADELAPPSIDLPTAPEPIPPAKPADTKVSHLFLNPVLTGGSDLDDRQGDDGLWVVIEPRNAAGQYVPEAGPMSIVVLDPTQAGEAARVARWDLDLAATQQKLDTRPTARGIALQLPWPTTPPTSDKLHLFVRYQTPDGRLLETDREVFIAQPGQVSQRWTPRHRSPHAPREESISRSEMPTAPIPAISTAAATTPTWSPFR